MNNGANVSGERILRMADLPGKVGLSRTMIYEQRKAGRFPEPFAILGNPYCLGWLESEIDSWIAEQARASRSNSELSAAVR
jgi:prophage regulatory protein